MNSVQLVGRLARDPEIRYSSGENANAVARFAVAVNRRFKNQNGEYEADFPSCVAFGKSAEIIEKYFHKGERIGLQGEIRTGSYTNKDGVKVYTTEVVVNNVEFVESKSNSNNLSNSRDDIEWTPAVDDDGDLPFA